jgi:hypothetical protein
MQVIVEKSGHETRRGRRSPSHSSASGSIMADGGARKACARRGPRAASPEARRWNGACEKIFLEKLVQTANVMAAARAVGLSARSAYLRRRTNPAFAAAWRVALDEGYAELEMVLLRHALTGSERIETVVDGASGAVKQTRTVHSYPLTIGLRMLMLHRAEAIRLRGVAADAEPGDAPDAVDRLRAEIDRVAERLAAPDPFADDDFEDREV